MVVVKSLHPQLILMNILNSNVEIQHFNVKFVVRRLPMKFLLTGIRQATKLVQSSVKFVMKDLLPNFLSANTVKPIKNPYCLNVRFAMKDFQHNLVSPDIEKLILQNYLHVNSVVEDLLLNFHSINTLKLTTSSKCSNVKFVTQDLLLKIASIDI